MRQTFDVRGGPDVARENLPKLREAMTQAGLDGFYVPHEDEFQNEYQPEANQRLAWATGFTGSAGAAFVLTDKAYIFVDGRYAIQIQDQAAKELLTIETFEPPGPWAFIEGLDLSGQTIGYDPKLMTPTAADGLKAALKDAGATPKAVSKNPIDKAWKGRPRQPMAKAYPLDTAFTGQVSAEKREQIAAHLKKKGLDAAVITAPHSVAWLFNIRGGDVKCSPLPMSRAILHSSGEADLFIAPKKVDDELRAHLGNQVAVHDIADLSKGLANLKGKKVQADPATASEWFFTTLKRNKADVVPAMDVCALPKALKNETELKGAQAAHDRDGVAIARFLHWIETKAKPGKTTEIDAVRTLEKIREESGELKDISFETISGFGANGAMAHYRVNKESSATFEEGHLFLVDSGGQYFDGTTDITRTVAIGEPTAEMKRHYTLVLKGHIAMTVVRFPEGTTGTHLDVLARHALWQAGMDYGHGTGHGVGSFLGVHEGPQRIAKGWNSVPLAAGMIVSNEPGYYIAGKYGIRIENLQYVVGPETIEGGDTPMFGFEVLTVAPLARNLIDLSLLTDEERAWVDDYHARVKDTIGPRLGDWPEVQSWLSDACAPL
ncbi:aminopeptidase P family protein [Ponticaulis profundi]|uniref:Aminopeptidase P family protein n=1 Tax=Ponticaulis profundi TaxID=2665222 RepID=A0ABW1S6F2_9PROT